MAERTRPAIKWRRQGPGQYISADGRLTITRIEAWEVGVEGDEYGHGADSWWEFSFAEAKRAAAKREGASA